MALRIVLMVLAGLVLAAALGLTYGAPVDLLAVVQHHYQGLQAFYAQYPLLTAGLFFACFTLLVSFMLPGSLPLMLLAGALFGPVPGVMLCVLAGTLGATNLFILTRYFFFRRIQARYGHKLRVVNRQVARYGAFYLLLLRLTPGLPTYVVAMMMGVTALRLATFIGVTVIGVIPWYTVYVSAGHMLTELDSTADILTARTLAFVAAAAGLLLLGVWIKTRAAIRAALPQGEEDAPPWQPEREQ